MVHVSFSVDAYSSLQKDSYLAYLCIFNGWNMIELSKFKREERKNRDGE
jgi:hypothetical protein